MIENNRAEGLVWMEWSDSHIWTETKDFPGGPVPKNPPANAGDTGLIPGPGKSHKMPQGS